MKHLIILLSFLSVQSVDQNRCPKCVGRIHQKEELLLTQEELVIDKKDFCRNHPSAYLVIVKSGSFPRRNLTRYTWAKELIDHFHIPVLYALASPNNVSVQQSILNEDQLNHDLLQFHLLENYYNLTLKTISVFHWYNRWCATRTRALLYFDDDLLVNVDRLIVYLRRWNESQTIEGWFEKSGKIQRSGMGGVSKEDFPIDYVPDYLWGAAVIYPSSVIRHALLPGIFQTKLPIFFRDDVFINGFIAEEMSVKRKLLNGIRSYDPTEDDLRRRIILIDFPSEEHRLRAWLCFRQGTHCNKNPLRLLSRIFFVVFLLLLLGKFFFHCIKEEVYRRLNSLGLSKPLFKRRSQTSIGLSRSFRKTHRIVSSLISSLIVLLVFYQMNRM